MALYSFGPLAFEVYPVNITDVSKETEATAVDKQVIGIRPPLEFTGPGPQTISFSVKLFPAKFGGLSSISAAEAIMNSGVPMVMVRGDGSNMGWFLLTKVTERNSYLMGNGVGRVVEADMTFRRDGAPSAGGFLGGLLSLFG